MSMIEAILSKALKEGTPEKIAEVVSEIAVKVKGEVAITTTALLLARTVQRVDYLTDDEMKRLYGDIRTLCLEFVSKGKGK